MTRTAGLPRNVGIKLDDKDIGRAKELLKYELDALTNKDFRYPTKTYLPRKLKEEDWLDQRQSSDFRVLEPGGRPSKWGKDMRDIGRLIEA